MVRKNLLPALLVIAAALLLFPTAYSEDETAYKSDFILKLVDYVQWPAGAGADADGATVIGVAGESPLLEALKSGAAAKASEGKKIKVKAVAAADPLTDCQIVFIATKDKAELAKVLKKIGTSPVLTVSDCQGFAGFGVIVNFFKEEGTGKVRFEVNTMAAGDAKLKISSQLLKLAKII